MSTAIAFDTHQFVKRLTEHGATEEQAEALSNEQVALLNGSLATKADIAAIQRDVEALRQETGADVANLKADLPKWMFGAMIAQGGPIVVLVKLL